MPVNMSTADRIIRTFLAVVIAVLYFRGQLTGILAIVLGVIAVAFLLSSFVGRCPAYSVLGISSLKRRSTT